MSKKTVRERVVRFFHIAPVHRKGYAWIIFGGVVIWLGSVYTVIFLERITASLEDWNVSQMQTYALYLLWVVIILFLQKLFIKVKMFHTMWVVSDSIDEIYLEKFIRADNNAVERVWTWRMISVYSKWIWIRNDLLVQVFVYVPMILVILVVSFGEVLQFGWNYVLIWLGVIVLELLWIFLFRWSLRYRKHKAKDISIEIDRLRVKWFMSKFEMLQQARMDTEIGTKKAHTYEWRWYKHRHKTLQAWSYDWSILFTNFLLVWVAYRVWTWVLQWQYTYADFVLLTGLVLLFKREMSTIVWFIQGMSDNRVHLEKFRALFDRIGEMKWYESWATFDYKTWDISLKWISYGYTEELVFSDFSLDIKWWKKTALVWVSWSGKSTLVKLIAGFLTISEWEMFVDGQNMSDVSLKSYYPHVWYLTQEPSVFDGTVRENLLYWYSWTDEHLQEKIEAALLDAHCEFVHTLPNWLWTEIGEKWVRLSGWQRQRLALAKVFLKNPSILILDEPTSALDSFSEECISDSLSRLFEWRTVLIIAHRLQTVKSADEIIVLGTHSEEKEVWTVILERGTHDELVDMWWQYANMLELQSWF